MLYIYLHTVHCTTTAPVAATAATARAARSTQLTNTVGQQSTGALNLMEVQWDTQASGVNALSAHEIIESRRSIKTVAAQSGREARAYRRAGCCGSPSPLVVALVGLWSALAAKQVISWCGRELAESGPGERPAADSGDRGAAAAVVARRRRLLWRSAAKQMQQRRKTARFL